MGLKWTKIDLIGSTETEVNLIGLNSNCLIFREKKIIFNKFKRTNYTLYYNYKIIIYFHASLESATSITNYKTLNILTIYSN